jgi:hypothetical protein
MGMLWNTKATEEMIATLLLEFSGDINLTGAAGDSPPITRWQKLRDLFDPGKNGSSRNLNNIAAGQGLFGGGVQGSQNDDNWQAWLKILGNSATGGSRHEKLRKLIFDGLDKTKYSEIVFSVIPRTKNGAIKVSDAGDATNDDGTVAKVIQIETPTVQAATLRLRAVRKAQKARAKAKKR